MRVLVGPRIDLEHDQAAVAVARALAGPGGPVVSLRDVGIGTLSRPLSHAEVVLLRQALTGGCESPCMRTVVGYVCRGLRLGCSRDADVEGAMEVVAITDHANLTWQSPLTGPNDESVGPRFPSMTGVYSPETVLSRLGTTEGIIAVRGVVAGVHDDGGSTGYEAEVAITHGHVAVSSELVPVVIVAAHLGLRVAAVLVA